jgi:hypothetical protein
MVLVLDVAAVDCSAESVVGWAEASLVLEAEADDVVDRGVTTTYCLDSEFNSAQVLGFDGRTSNRPTPPSQQFGISSQQNDVSRPVTLEQETRSWPTLSQSGILRQHITGSAGSREFAIRV